MSCRSVCARLGVCVMILDQADEIAGATARGWWPAPSHHSSHLRDQWPVPAAGRPQIARMVLDSTSDLQPKAARDFTRVMLDRWTLSDQAEDATVVVSELVSNALLHGLADLQGTARRRVQLVLLHHPRRLLVVVTDPSHHAPAITVPRPDEFSERGRGLQMVQAISSAWGWVPFACGGKAVWAAIELTPMRSATHRPGQPPATSIQGETTPGQRRSLAALLYSHLT